MKKFFITIILFFLGTKLVLADLLTSDFGGKVLLYLPKDPACTALIESIFGSLTVLTLGTVRIDISVGRLDILEYSSKTPSPLSLALIEASIRLGYVAQPVKIKLYKVYDYGRYKIPNVWVVGKYFDLCKSPDNFPLLKEAIKKICDAASQNCPLGHTLLMIGTGQIPSF